MQSIQINLSIPSNIKFIHGTGSHLIATDIESLTRPLFMRGQIAPGQYVSRITEKLH